MATYRQTNAGTYEFFVDIGKNPATGKRIRKSKTFDRVKDGKKWAAEMELKHKQEIIVDPNKYTIANLLLEWYEDYAEIELSPTTYEGYKTIIDVHLIPSLGALKANELQGRHIKSYISKKRKTGRADGVKGGLSSTTLLQHYRVLSQALKYGRKWKIISHNPLEFVTPPSKRDTEIEALNKEQLHKLLNCAEGWIYDLIYFAVNTGMRRGEIMGLRWSDVEFENKIVRVRQALIISQEKGAIFKKPKSSSSIRGVDITEDVIEILKNRKKQQNEYKLLLGSDYIDNYNLVFGKNNGNKFYPKVASDRFNRVAKKAGLEQFTFHSLRHTHATLMLQAEVHPKVVQERLGHSDISTTLNTYSHVIPTMQKEAAEKFKNLLER
ncbi:tyrosine-type recombinase/integrase [Fuchsiella alkaliacetigena]|uniref:tyrosine-type recombinase/integrase n=1 Tax=Fuchsiella alkaliacetigena TaxID=957042 RepID=UPI00200A17E8|nr:tyrosine-type recombinase/integrase [Fuchsiella alkaliacetigena]MCK8823989.1 site-specific integrase [Fuchsiella alkaliacetigena]